MDVLTLPPEEDVGLPLLGLQMYNNTGNGVSGFHYDPIFSDVARERRDVSPIINSAVMFLLPDLRHRIRVVHRVM